VLVWVLVLARWWLTLRLLVLRGRTQVVCRCLLLSCTSSLSVSLAEDAMLWGL
jgi:hypothetical protein